MFKKANILNNLLFKKANANKEKAKPKRSRR